MKQLFTLSILLLACFGIATAQSSFSVSTTEVTKVVPDSVLDVEAHFELTNLTNATQTIRWVRTEVEMIDSNCVTQVCDFNLCYLPHISTKTFDAAPNESKDIIMHFLNVNYYPGASGIIRLTMSNVNIPEDTITVTFRFTSSLSGTNDLPLASVKLYPNPTTDYFLLDHADDVSRIRMFSMDSREVAQFTATPGERYSLAAQPAGTYFLALEDKKGRVFQSIELVKK